MLKSWNFKILKFWKLWILKSEPREFQTLNFETCFLRLSTPEQFQGHAGWREWVWPRPRTFSRNYIQPLYRVDLCFDISSNFLEFTRRARDAQREERIKKCILSLRVARATRKGRDASLLLRVAASVTRVCLESRQSVQNNRTSRRGPRHRTSHSVREAANARTRQARAISSGPLHSEIPRIKDPLSNSEIKRRGETM